MGAALTGPVQPEGVSWKGKGPAFLVEDEILWDLPGWGWGVRCGAGTVSTALCRRACPCGDSDTVQGFDRKITFLFSPEVLWSFLSPHKALWAITFPGVFLFLKKWKPHETEHTAPHHQLASATRSLLVTLRSARSPLGSDGQVLALRWRTRRGGGGVGREAGLLGPGSAHPGV